jgi:hypothetical protein
MYILEPIFLSHVVLRFSPSDLPETMPWWKQIIIVEYMLEAC